MFNVFDKIQCLSIHTPGVDYIIVNARIVMSILNNNVSDHVMDVVGEIHVHNLRFSYALEGLIHFKLNYHLTMLVGLGAYLGRYL